MLSSVLNSERAIHMNIVIFRAFVRVRELIAANRDLADRVAKLESGQRQTGSILDALVDEIDGMASALRNVTFAQYRESYTLRRAAERAVQIVPENQRAEGRG